MRVKDNIAIDIRKVSEPDLKEFIQSKGQPGYRAKQIIEWIRHKGATDFDQMTNLPKDLREILKAEFTFLPIQIDHVQKSKDGTIKTRFVLHDGYYIEAVLIPSVADKRYTICVSSQVGCSLTCSFCATGQMKMQRGLDAAEIVDQYRLVNDQCRTHFNAELTNVVFMGMGEPLLNYNNVMEAIHWLTDQRGIAMPPRRITISTAGIAKLILRLADEPIRVNLALSLHAADDEKRNSIMPINETNNLEVLMRALRYFYEKNKRRISYEYIAFDQFNTSSKDALNLVKLCHPFPVLVNIIEYNPVEGVSFTKAGSEEIDRFARILLKHRVNVTVRKSRGKDIDAACGQLANKG